MKKSLTNRSEGTKLLSMVSGNLDRALHGLKEFELPYSFLSGREELFATSDRNRQSATSYKCGMPENLRR
jgi:hypothetical protein